MNKLEEQISYYKTVPTNDKIFVPKEYYEVKCDCYRSHTDKKCDNLLFNHEYIFINLRNSLFELWPCTFMQFTIDDKLVLLCSDSHFDRLPAIFEFRLSMFGRKAKYTIEKSKIMSQDINSFEFKIVKLTIKRDFIGTYLSNTGCWRELRVNKKGDHIGKKPSI